MTAKGDKVGTLYLCTGNTDSSISLASTGVDTTLWHHKMGHMSEKGMQILHKRNLLPDLKQIDLDFCEHCVYGKQKRVRFLRVGKENDPSGFFEMTMVEFYLHAFIHHWKNLTKSEKINELYSH